jgi:hypothetical protein
MGRLVRDLFDRVQPPGGRLIDDDEGHVDVLRPRQRTYAAGFHSAGAHPVLDPTTLASSRVFVPVVAEPPSGPPGTSFTITWSSEVPLPGFVFDVQVKAPGSGSWVYLVKGGTSTSTTVSPDTPGTYKFRARLQTGGAHSGWSPIASITVT